ncbi:hypothetical protein JRQ81_004345 [Phrynocephalus forsythii]|uniref:BED-type domain-containing protein n=1 Tax=Phrynocephalus forsythii TaxID=171643 RepID=A0A9Q1AUZ1_9SAUR|nr:hypothetical protein JRQ81_004345 [Phrynocephalus forsythii]
MMPRWGRGRRPQPATFHSRRAVPHHLQDPHSQTSLEDVVAEQPLTTSPTASSQPLLKEEETCQSAVRDLFSYLKEKEEEEEEEEEDMAEMSTYPLTTSGQAAVKQTSHSEVHEMLSYFKKEEEEEEEEEVAEVVSFSPPKVLPPSATHSVPPVYAPSGATSQALPPGGMELMHFFAPLAHFSASSSHSRRGRGREASADGAPPPIPKKTTSAVWDYFTLDPREPCVAVCSACQKRVRRGKDGGTRPGTTALHKHLKVHHGLHLPGVAVVPPSPLMPAKERPHSAASGVVAEPPAPAFQLNRQDRNQPYYPPTHPTALQLASDTAWMLAVDMQPLSFVDNEGFRRLMATAQPRWKVPSRSFFATKAVPELSKLVSRAVRQAVACSVGRVVHVAIDTWEGQRATTYMSVTGHWVAEFFGALCRKHATLSVCAFEGPCTPGDIASKLREVLQDWLHDLKTGGVVSHGGGHMANAIRELRLKHVPCLAHGLQRVAQAFLAADVHVGRLLKTARRVCRHYSRSATVRRRLLELQAHLGLPPSAGQEARTRSNSTLSMLERLHRQRQAVGVMLKDEEAGTHQMRFSPADWKVVKCLTEILKPFEDATMLVTRPNATLCQALPLLWFLEEQLRVLRTRFSQENNNTAAHLTTQALGCLEADAQLGEMKSSLMYQVAAFLDPRFRDITTMKLGGADTSHAAMLKEHLLDLARRSYSPPGPEAEFSQASPSDPAAPPASGSSNPTGSAAWQFTMKRWRAITKSDPTTGLATEGGAAAAALRELEEYLRDNVDHIGENADPMLYWQGKMGVWPALFKVAVFHFGCPPTSASSEDLSIVASSLAVGDPSKNLSPANVKMFAFIRKNRHLIPQDWRLSLGDLSSSQSAMGPREDLDTEEEDDLLRADEEPEDERES